MGRHKDLNALDLHKIAAFTFADAASRLSGTGYTFDISDNGKVAHQTDDDTFYVLTDYTGPTWSLLGGGGGGGQANTASNQGVGGIGLFKQKVALDLEFKNLNTITDGAITLTDDTGNNEVDVSVDITGTTEESGIVNGDELLFYDADAAALRKIDFADLSAAIGGGGADELIKVSSNDTTAKYLEDAIVSADTKLTIATINDGLDEDLQITLNEANIVHQNLSGAGTNTHAQIDTHIADSTLHFTEASIDHTAISNIGTNTHAQIDAHIADSTLHFTVGSIDHTAISNIGTNTHAQIDTHIADTSDPHGATLTQTTLNLTTLNDSLGNLVMDVSTNVLYHADGTTTSIDFENDTLTDGFNNVVTVDWRNGYLYDSTGINTTVVWSSGFLGDLSGNSTVDWFLGTLFDPASNNATVDWANQILTDSSATNAIDWFSRYLYDVGGTLLVDFSSALALQNGRDIDLTSGNQIIWDSSPGQDHTAKGDVANHGVASDVNFGDVLYMNSSSNLVLADADASTTMPAVAMAISTVNGDPTPTTADVLIRGYARDDTWAWTPGGDLYVSTTGTTGNTLTQTKPAGAGDQVQRVGFAVTANVIYFHPETSEEVSAGGSGGFSQKLNWQASGLEALETNFAPLEIVDVGTIVVTAGAYDDTTIEYRNGTFQVSDNIDTSGTVTFRAYVFAKTAAASKNIELRFEHLAKANGEALDGSYTAEDSGDVAIDATQNDITQVEWTETVSNLGWAAEDTVQFRLSRIAPSANNLSGDMYLFNFQIEIPQV